MILRNTKLFIGIILVFAFLSIGVFGLFQFNHNSLMPMTDCPYLENGFSMCENIIDHINNWQQFINVVPTVLYVFSIVLLGLFLYFLDQRNFLNQKLYLYIWKYYIDNKVLYIFRHKIIQWLSLFENSPSFSFVRHS